MHTFFIWSLVLLWFNTTAATSVDHQLVAAAGGDVHTCIDKERQALLDFKAHLRDPQGMLSTWKPDEEDDCCQWSGVGCSNQTGHVTSLDLFNRYYGSSGLHGEISLSLLNLTYLNHLDLSFNSLHGNLPELICSMTHLTFLSLRQNRFSGTIHKFICSMTRLTYINLAQNQFTGTIPKLICSMTRLTYINLGQNQFTGTIPESIGNMTKLTELDLGWNNFSGVIPKSIASLTQLKILDLSSNFFYGTIPTELGNLTNLEYLLVSSNLTFENLDWLSSLSSLQFLSLDGTSLAKANNWVNLVTGLQNLKDLNLVGCDLSQVMHPYSSSVNSSLSLTNLYVDNNNLNSSMFRWLCPLVGNKLTALSLSGNKFDEKLSDFLNNLSGCTSATLKVLYASSNQFTGSLSHEIHMFSSLEHLDLSSNKLNGTLSDKLWELPNLERLYLSSTSLRGAISHNIGKSNLVYIDLSNNSLQGVLFQDDMSNHSWRIQYIDFSSNNLGPRFPEWIQKVKNLTY